MAPVGVVSLKPMVRGPVSMVVSSWEPPLSLVRLDTTAASSKGKAAARIQALTVMLPPSCSVAPLPRSTKAPLPSKDRALPEWPAAVQPAPLSVPVLLLPEASAVVAPEPSLKPYAATRPSLAAACARFAPALQSSEPARIRITESAIPLARPRATVGSLFWRSKRAPLLVHVSVLHGLDS